MGRMLEREANVGSTARISLLALLLVGCSTPVVDITPGPPQMDQVTVVEVTARGTGGRVELVQANRRARATGSGCFGA